MIVPCLILRGRRQALRYVTSRNLRDRLYRELERNLALKVEDGETADTFLVSGRGTLHLTILIENMKELKFVTISNSVSSGCLKNNVNFVGGEKVMNL